MPTCSGVACDGPRRTVWSSRHLLPIPPVTAAVARGDGACRLAEVDVGEVSGSGAVEVPDRPGGGWRALLEDVLGGADTPTAELVAVLTGSPARPTRWSPATLEEAWRAAHTAGEQPLASVTEAPPTAPPAGAEFSEAG
jgi:hypothetical protein